MKLLIGIPAYNEVKTIKSVLNSLPKKIIGISKIDKLVVNDGSADNTAKVCENQGAVVVSHILNRGLGAALKTIFTYAKTRDYDLLVTIDADGQHEGKDIIKVVDQLLTKRCNVVIGTRWREGKKNPFIRYLVNQLGNVITYILFGVWTSDSQSGFRGFDKKAINMINLQSDGMEVSSEFFREIKRNNLFLAEVPISAIYTDYSKSKGQRISNAPNIIFQLLIKLLK